MVQSQKILNEMSGPSYDFKLEAIQELLMLVKDRKSNLNKEFWDEIAQKLWQHLEECLEKLDDQLLCATCFYSVITLADKEDYYLDKLLHIFGPDPSSPSQVIHHRMPESRQLQFTVNEPSTNMTEKQQSSHTLQVVSLIYGIFQSSFLIQQQNDNTTKIAAVLKEMFHLLLLMAYEYSQYTFLAFKTIKLFKKLCGGALEKYIFNKENQAKLLALVNYNWENPVTGVRDLNRCIFQTVISTLDNITYEKALNEINGFYWNKAKFLMLSEIIENYNGDVMSLVCSHEQWIDGLMYSLHKPGLVSAGADMYFALLKKINYKNDWCQLFLYPILTILNGPNSKAIENFRNYWCLTTMKKFGTLTQVLISELENLEDSEQLLYSKLCVMKQANKLGIIDKNLSDDNTAFRNTVLTGIEHYNNHIRMLAFDIICVSQRKSIPNAMEYNLILNYLHDNVNSDSTVLRLSMFSSFNTFLVQLHCTFLNVITKNDNNEAIENLLTFCKSLQSFIINNFMVNGNYQRKITSIKLCNFILTYFSEIPRKRKDQTRQATVTLIGFLKQKECWSLSAESFIMNLINLLKDPADDVRDSVIKILLRHYPKELQNVTVMTHIVEDAKLSMKSKYFYEIGCGQSMFKLIINLLIKEKEISNTEYKSVDNIFDFAYDELVTQHAANTNVLESIETGKQLHSFMSILLVVLEECISSSYKINIDNRISELLDVLESISNNFAWEQEGSSDFSKMNDMVQVIIDSYSYQNFVDKDDATKISGIQQVVLNCIWLSVKASCDLASVLVQYNQNNFDMCERCLYIITRVLETSRHKGAIEAAGAALGRGIQYLTSLPEKGRNMPEENDVSKLPFILLKRKLNDLIYETNKMSSITRRGAGLSIMVHRIVSSDIKKGKPLFHYFIKTLLKICNTKDYAACHPDTIKDDTMENQVDLPKAIYIHFMTRIVTDSSLATDMMYYSVELAELAFGNLTSSHWQIRNAALQLYGALIPRLIGQKKASGTDEETIATVACDEMRTHLPQLWQYIIEQLKQNAGEDLIQTHSNLVPILNMLASSAKRYNFSMHLEHEIEFYNLFSYLIHLLNSPINTVRRLTARTIFNIYEFEFICNGILEQKNMTENLLHGLLLLLNLCHNYYSTDPNFENLFIKLKGIFLSILNTGMHSYLCKKLFEDVYVNNIDMRDIENTILELTSNIGPGIQTWAEARLKKYINKCPWDNIPSLLKQILQLCDNEKYCEFVLVKMETQHSIPNHVILEVAHILIAFEKKYCSCIVWKILYHIALKSDLHGHIDIHELFNKLEGINTYNLRYMIPLIARYIENISNDNHSRLLKIISTLSDFENADVDMRNIAAVANNELAHKFAKLADSLKVISIKCTALLLQDEDEDVRNLSVKFYSILSKEGRELQPYICLNKILDPSFLQTVFGEPQISIQELITRLSDVLNLNHDIDMYNPFANDSKNIYFEPDILKQIVDKFKCKLK